MPVEPVETPVESSANPTPVLVVGEALIDIVHRPDEDDPVEHVGGSPFNVANGLARLGHRTTLACWIGDDERGKRIVHSANEAGTKVLETSRAAARTSTADATLDETGQATYTFELEWRLPSIGELGSFGHVHTGSIAATLEPGGSELVEVIQRARDHATISYDPNVRPALMGSPDRVLGRIETLIAAADVVKASDEDIAWLYPDAAMDEVIRRWGGLGAPLVVITRGADGARIGLNSAGEQWNVTQRRVNVVDTVGAGDSFMAGLVSGLLDSRLAGGPEARLALRLADRGSVGSAIERALGSSALTVCRAGAHAPSREELMHG